MRQVQPQSATTNRPFVLLWHEAPRGSDFTSHWDLMIQDGDELATWRLERDLERSAKQTARRLKNHRLAYLTYEGPVSELRGSVRRLNHGNFVVQSWTAHEISGELHSQTGTICLRLSRSDASDQWELTARTNGS